MQTVEQEIYRIVDLFGMKASVIAKAMGISQQTFYSKKDPNNSRHHFNPKNLADLIAYIKTEADKL